MKHLNHLAIALVALLVAVPVQAQEASGTDLEAELRSMVTETTPADEDRSAIRAFLEREDVSEAAGSHGIDVDALAQGVETLGADAAASLAERVDQTENRLDQVGGDTVVITTTGIIIGLLILILIIVA